MKFDVLILKSVRSWDTEGVGCDTRKWQVKFRDFQKRARGTDAAPQRTTKLPCTYKLQASVAQKVDSAIHRIIHYSADKHQQNQLSYRVDSD